MVDALVQSGDEGRSRLR